MGENAGLGCAVMSYHAVPPDLLETGDALAPWAERAYGAALRVNDAKRRARRAPAKTTRRRARREQI